MTSRYAQVTGAAPSVVVNAPPSIHPLHSIHSFHQSIPQLHWAVPVAGREGHGVSTQGQQVTTAAAATTSGEVMAATAAAAAATSVSDLHDAPELPHDTQLRPVPVTRYVMEHLCCAVVFPLTRATPGPAVSALQLQSPCMQTFISGRFCCSPASRRHLTTGSLNHCFCYLLACCRAGVAVRLTGPVTSTEAANACKPGNSLKFSRPWPCDISLLIVQVQVCVCTCGYV